MRTIRDWVLLCLLLPMLVLAVLLVLIFQPIPLRDCKLG